MENTTEDVVLGPNQYGKAEVRVVRVTRDTPRHEIADLSVSSQLRGNFVDTHETGDNSLVVATDTQKNTVYGFAKEYGISSPEAFLLTLADHFTGEFEHVTGGRWEAEQYAWARIDDHDHAFSRIGTETRTALVQREGDQTWVLSGLQDLTVLKSTGSEFHGFPRDRFTSLVETDDRILATSVSCKWRYADVDASFDFNAAYDAARSAMLTAFADTHSLALQQTLYAMAKAVLAAVPEAVEVRYSMPNKHHFLVDLKPFGLENPNEVFYAADRPYGLIEAAVLRAGVDEAPAAWATAGGFL